MALPDTPAAPWPPQEWRAAYERYSEHAAWFSGDPAQLIATYLGAPVRTSVWRTNFDRFWARGQLAPQRRQMIHVPMAGDISSTSADLLFAEPPDILIPEDIPLQTRLQDCIAAEGMVRTFNESAETVSALGGGFLRVTWNKDVEPDHPLLTSVDADMAVPEFQWGRLMAVTFWRAMGDGKTIWRHLERHEPGAIVHALYRGDMHTIGDRMPLGTMPDLGIQDEVITTSIDQLTAVYIPNMRPNRRFRGSMLGRSDYDGCEAMMDSLDETWTSWMRDLRLARARLIVPKDFMDAQNKGDGSTFDLDQEVFEALPMPINKGAEFITPSQFAIRTKEHLETAMALVERIIASSGYSSATFGLAPEKAVAQTATEITNRERRTYVTRAKKISYWSHPLAEILETYLAIDAAQGFNHHDVIRPQVNFPDSIRTDPKEQAMIVGLLRQAESMSVETRVRMLHKEWTDTQVNDETARLLAEGASSGKTMLREMGPAPAGEPPLTTGEEAGAVAPPQPPPVPVPPSTTGVKPTIQQRGPGAPPAAATMKVPGASMPAGPKSGARTAPAATPTPGPPMTK